MGWPGFLSLESWPEAFHSFCTPENKIKHSIPRSPRYGGPDNGAICYLLKVFERLVVDALLLDQIVELIVQLITVGFLLNFSILELNPNS